MIIPAFVDKYAWLYPDKTAVIFEDRRCSFRQLKDRVDRLASALSRLGVSKGDRVAIILENCFEFPEIYFAIGKMGAVATPLNYRLTGSELAQLLSHSGANTLIVASVLVDRIVPFIPELATVKHYVCVGEKTEGTLDYDDLIGTASGKLPEVEVSMEDLFVLAYTGGTTGRPKGAMLTHRNLHCVCNSWIVESTVPRGSGLLVTPLFHVGSIWPLCFNFMLGNTVTILARVDPEQILRTIERERITYTMWLSSIINAILSYLGSSKFDLSSLDLITCGGGPLAPVQLRRLAEFAKCRVHFAGGQTETGAVVSAKVEEQLRTQPETLGSAGRVAYDFEVRVVDEQDNDVPVGRTGELCARGDAVMKGYWEMPEETAQALKGGWLHSGDLVRMDEKGYVYYLDRKKDMIKTGGENVYCKEVEDVIYEHPAVAEVAVIGVPDEKWGEMVKALVILKAGEKTTEEEIIALCKQRLAGFKCPKSVEFYDSFPKTGLMKIAKNVLREKYWAGFERRVH